MNVQAEKAEIIKIFEKINDADIIQAVKDLLDFTSNNTDPSLESALDKSLQQSNARKVRPHHEVMAEIRAYFSK
jgi:hypothetical protein